MNGATFYRRMPDGTYQDLTDGFRRYHEEITISPTFAVADIKDLSRIVNKLPPLPKDESKPILDGKSFDRDLVVMWLAYKEAKALTGVPSAP
jgi:hypothetical protein